MADEKNAEDQTQPSRPGQVMQQSNPENGEPSKPRRRLIWYWVAGLLFLLIVALAAHYFRTRSAEQNKAAAGEGRSGRGAQGPASITAGQSKSGDIDIFVNALGTVTPIYTVTVYSQITGRVMKVYYTEGQMIKEADPLIDIDPRPYEATLTQAQGNLEHDQGLLAQAKIDLARYQAAYARNAIAKQQLDDQEQAVKQYEGTVKADQGTVDYDQVQLGYCHIVAPITGRVGLRLVDPGNTIFSGASSTLVVITQLQPITVVFNVSEDDLAQVQSQLKGGHALRVNAYDRANDKQLESGTLTSLDNQIDTTTGTIKFRATFPNRSLNLFPNQFVNARMLVRTLRKTVLVPTAAVQQNGTQAFVYIVQQNNTVSVQNVTVLTTNEQETAVTGINAGVTVATSGFDRLENGVQVNVGQPAQSKPAQ